MSGGLLETSGWSPTMAAERAALHVEMCQAEGGFARIEALGDGRVCWVGPSGIWRHRPDGYRLMAAEAAARAEAERIARKQADLAARKEAVAAKRLELAANARKAMLAKAQARMADHLQAKAAEKEARRAAKAKAKIKARAAATRRRRAKARRAAQSIPAATERAISARNVKRAIKIMAETAGRHGVSVSVMIGQRGSQRAVSARREAMWLIRELRDDQGEPAFTLQRLGRLFRRHASTVHTELGLYAALSASPESDGETNCNQPWRPAA